MMLYIIGEFRGQPPTHAQFAPKSLVQLLSALQMTTSDADLRPDPRRGQRRSEGQAAVYPHLEQVGGPCPAV